MVPFKSSVEHGFELLQFLLADIAGAEGVDEVLVKRAVENSLQKSAGQIAERFFAFDLRQVHVRLALAPMGDQVFLLHHLQQRQDGRVRQPGVGVSVVSGVHRLANLADGRFAAVPENLEGFEFAVGRLLVSHRFFCGGREEFYGSGSSCTGDSTGWPVDVKEIILKR